MPACWCKDFTCNVSEGEIVEIDASLLAERFGKRVKVRCTFFVSVSS